MARGRGLRGETHFHRCCNCCIWRREGERKVWRGRELRVWASCNTPRCIVLHLLRHLSIVCGRLWGSLVLGHWSFGPPFLFLGAGAGSARRSLSIFTGALRGFAKFAQRGAARNGSCLGKSRKEFWILRKSATGGRNTRIDGDMDGTRRMSGGTRGARDPRNNKCRRPLNTEHTEITEDTEKNDSVSSR